MNAGAAPQDSPATPPAGGGDVDVVRGPLRAAGVACVRPYRGAMALLVVLMLVQSGLSLVQPWMAGRFSEALLGGQPVTALLLAWLALLAALAGAGWAANVMSTEIGLGLVAEGSCRVFDHLQRLPLPWHWGRSRGELVSMLVGDVERLGFFVTHTLLPALPQALTCLGALVMMVAIEPAMGLTLSVLIPVAYLLVRLAARRLRPLGEATVQAHAGRSAEAEQALLLMPLTRAFNAQLAASARYAARAGHLREVERARVRRESAIAPMVRVMAAAVVMLVLALASRRVADGSMAPSDLISLLLYGLLLTQPVSQLAGVYGQLQSAKGATRRLAGVMAQAPEPEGGPLRLPHVRGDLELRGLRYAHPGRHPLYEGIDLRIDAGQTVALTGPNGAGKTTLAHLLMRFMDPDAGAILLDGHDIRQLATHNLREHVGLVSQQVVLANATVWDNLLLGRSDATTEEVLAAVRAARAEAFIERLPHGYQTVVGDDGVRLSGGQRQRLALARTLLRNPAVLVLDEATAMFDPEAERDFIAQCHEALKGKTVILITHRPASLALADRVVRLHDGRLEEVVPSERERNSMAAGHAAG